MLAKYIVGTKGTLTLTTKSEYASDIVAFAFTSKIIFTFWFVTFHT